MNEPERNRNEPAMNTDEPEMNTNEPAINEYEPAINEYEPNMHTDVPSSEGFNSMVRKLIESKSLFYCDGSKKYSSCGFSERKWVKSLEELLDLKAKERVNIALDLKGSGLMALDIDCAVIGVKFLELLARLEVNCYASTSPRGGCHVFFAHNPEMVDYRQGNIVTCLGFGCEFFKTKPIVMFGPGYGAAIYPSSLPLSPMPSFLYPLTERCQEAWVKEAEILKGSLIEEGDRNNTLFTHSLLMARHLGSYREPALVIEILAEHFCSPPYTDKITHITDRLTDLKSGQSDPEMKGKGNKQTTAFELSQSLGPYKLVYYPADNKWFRLDEKDCLWKIIDQYDLKVYLWGITEARGKPRLKLHAMKSLIKELQNYCKPRIEHFPAEEGLAFRNGFLNFSTFEFSAHNKNRFTPSFLDINYDPEAQLPQRVKEILSFWLSGSNHYLNHLRGFLARILIRPNGFRSGLVISGPPRTGKSTLVNLIRFICNKDFAVLREGVKAFDRAVWRNARVVVINDCSNLERPTRVSIRQLTGSDLITYEMKYVQKTTDQAFEFRGVVIIVTNLSKSELMSNTGDVALAQRFVEIPFTNIPSTDQINPELRYILQESIPALINWALYVDPQVMRVQAGALNLDSEPSIFALFLMQYLVFDKSATITISDLNSHFSEHMNLYGVHSYELKIPVKRGIINECAATFGCTVTEGHRKRQRVLKGLRFLNKNNEGGAEETNFKMPKGYRLDHIDPWSTEARFILEATQNVNVY